MHSFLRILRRIRCLLIGTEARALVFGRCLRTNRPYLIGVIDVRAFVTATPVETLGLLAWSSQNLRQLFSECVDLLLDLIHPSQLLG